MCIHGYYKHVLVPTALICHHHVVYLLPVRVEEWSERDKIYSVLHMMLPAFRRVTESILFLHVLQF